MKKLATVLALLSAWSSACGPRGVSQPVDSYAEVDQLIERRNFPQAVERLEALRGQQGPEATLVLRLANAYVAENEIPKAVARLREGIAKHPEAGPLELRLGQIYLDLEQQALAQEALEKARANGAADDQVSLALGMCMGRLGNLDRADQEFTRALKAGADERVVFYNQALILSQKGQGERARELLEQALLKDPHWAAAKRELARILISLDPNNAAQVNRAMGILWEIKDELSDDWRVQEVMGDGWLCLGDYDAALTAYTEALRLGRSPKSVEDKYRVAKTRQKAALQAKNLGQDKAAETPK